jgi:FKBP-type peptidyl-prolyl cis-trans isomerase FkpA
MKKLLFLLIIWVYSNSSFAQDINDGYTKAEGGMEYKIVYFGKDDLLKPGLFLEMHFTNLLARKGKQDSVLNNTREMGAPQVMQFDTLNIPPAYFKIFMQMKVEDSVGTRTTVDSMFKSNPDQMPPFMKRGDMIYTNIKIINAFNTQKEADSARTIALENAERVSKSKAEALAREDDKAITDYITTNKIKAIKTSQGVYVETVKSGVGAFLNSKSIVKIKYTGTTLGGVMFDSNVDPSKGHTDPLSVNLTNDKSIGNGVIPGLENGMYKLQKGSKAKIYIPSGLAYGIRVAGPDLPPNANLIFYIEVVSTITKAQLRAQNLAAAAKAKKTEMEEQMKSIPKTKNKPKTTTTKKKSSKR